MKYTYLFIDLSSAIVPLIASFHPAIRFYKEFRAFLPANLISSLIFIAWDVIFTEKGIWGFNENFIIGVKLYNLPLEEVLFFFCIPFACVFTYKALTRFWATSWNNKCEKLVSFLLIIIFFCAGLVFWKRTYTAATFLSFSILLFVFKVVLSQRWLGNFYRVWLILLLPFFIVNGILTGSGLSSPVVWYKDEETMGIRLLTIPAEDFVYGLELIMLTVFFYEWFLMIFQNVPLREPRGHIIEQR